KDQIHAIRPPRGPRPESEHVVVDVGRAHRRATIGDRLELLVLPEGPLAPVDTADDAGGRRRGDQGAKAGDLTRERTVGIAVVSETVAEGLLRIGDAGLKEIDHALLAGVLEKLQAGDGDGNRDLPDRILGSR